MTLVTDKMEIAERLDAMGPVVKRRIGAENAIIREFNRTVVADINYDNNGELVMAFARFDCHQFVRDNPSIAAAIDFDLEEFLQILIEEYEEFGKVEVSEVA